MFHVKHFKIYIQTQYNVSRETSYYYILCNKRET